MLDDYQESIPVAYANFNWEDKVAIIATGVHIKLKCKGFKSCLLFMSDMAPQCFNSWKEIFDVTNTKYLWVWMACWSWLDESNKKSIDTLLTESSQIQVQTVNWLN